MRVASRTITGRSLQVVARTLQRAERTALELQLAEKLVVPLGAGQRIGSPLLLDVARLAIDVRHGRQQASEIERAGAELGVARAIGDDVLQVEAPITVAVALEIGERIAAHHR